MLKAAHTNLQATMWKIQIDHQAGNLIKEVIYFFQTGQWVVTMIDHRAVNQINEVRYFFKTAQWAMPDQLKISGWELDLINNLIMTKSIRGKPRAD